jgi:hypothetical protein
MGFFHIYPLEKDFRSCVALLTYGDDAIGSVKEKYKNFNFVSYKNFLAAHGMKLTLPSKTDEEVEFLHQNEVDFLKRKSNYISEIGSSIGKLDEDSIFKSLHSNIQSHSVTEREVACSCVEGALHEWFAFGREHYEMRREQMHQVCNDLNLPVHALNYTFDERVQKWLDCYAPAVEPHSLNEKSLDTIPGEKKALTSRQLYAYLCGGSLTPRQPQNNQPENSESHLIGSSNSPADEGKSGLDGHIPEVGKATKSFKKSIKKVISNNSLRKSPTSVREDITPHVGNSPTLGSLHHKVRCAIGILNALEKNLVKQKEVDILHQILCAKGILASLENGLEDVLIAQIVEAEHQFEGAEKDSTPPTMAQHQFEDAVEDSKPPAIPDIQPHAADELPSDSIAGGEEASDNTHANMQFDDKESGIMDSRGDAMIPTQLHLEDDLVSLQKFLERPIKIREFNWLVNTQIAVNFNPWQDFFENKRVINRIANYKICVQYYT